MQLTDFLSRFSRVKPTGKGYTAQCTGHDDGKNSLSIRAEGGKILIHCFAGCRRKAEAEDLCDSCDGSGLFEAAVCRDCLGQGVLLYEEEYATLLEVAGYSDDILDAEIIEQLASPTFL